MLLRKLNEKDIPFMLEWMRDPDINKMFQFDASKMTEESSRKFINSSYTDVDKHYAIIDEEDVYMGTVSLKNINNTNSSAEYAISLRKAAIGAGYAQFATTEILKIAFYELDLNKVYLNVISENIRANKFYEKFGLIYEGEFKEHFCIRGEYKDVKWYRILKSEFEMLMSSKNENNCSRRK